MLTRPLGSSPTVIITEPALVESRLASLNPALNSELLLEANKRGFEQRIEITPAHPPTAAGTTHWIHFVGALRSRLLSERWFLQDRNNCPLIVSVDQSIAIVVMTGNADTGKLHGDPTNQADKGSVLDAGVRNNGQYDLFEVDAISELKSNNGGTQLWVLLYHVEKGKDGPIEIRTELSFPSKFKRKKITGWSQRIILNSMDPRKQSKVISSLPIKPIDFAVERKIGV